MEHRGEVRGQLFGVLTRLGDRLPSHQATFILELIDVSEWGTALEQIADVLSEDEVVLRDDERNDLLALNRMLGMGERVPAALSLCPQIA
ncbi:MafI family immunity protein [Agromyces cerinus subsp. nitratus]|uniref:MafI family immunity protein n=1 Tax=Agromyces cerinus TaxID=33878 RepID=UPI00195BBACA